MIDYDVFDTWITDEIYGVMDDWWWDLIVDHVYGKDADKVSSSYVASIHMYVEKLPKYHRRLVRQFNRELKR